ncbi:hypothetical protein NE237_012600 [Protea cynaroides]|uniref:DEAD/DEAH-box helicase domain-containing protein n=1 Tax=Protea cynaroides TaxID=273540 RepID=A0A9Q0JY62_9MAGN|nr:hypothetical protein NE237_012600 [Protea cynaroides]
MSEQNEAEGPYAVVMAPIGELAQQIEDETVKFAHYLGIKVVSIFGGQSIEEQGFKIRQGCEVVREKKSEFDGKKMACVGLRCSGGVGKAFLSTFNVNADQQQRSCSCRHNYLKRCSDLVLSSLKSTPQGMPSNFRQCLL